MTSRKSSILYKKRIPNGKVSAFPLGIFLNVGQEIVYNVRQMNQRKLVTVAKPD